MSEPEKHMIGVFTENYFREVVQITCHQMYADGYTAGISDGAGYYGAGGCSAYVLDDNGIAEMREYEEATEVKRALVRLAEIICKDSGDEG